jgi:hypothetical protein
VAAPAPIGGELPDEEDHNLAFGISLAVLLECLQIFGAEASREKWHSGGNGSTGTIGGTHSRSGLGAVFDQTVLRIGGTCKFSYVGQGHPLYLMSVFPGVEGHQLAPANVKLGWRKMVSSQLVS